MPAKNIYDELTVGSHFGRRLTVTETHLVMANAIFADSVPLHTDHVTGEESGYGGRIMPGPVIAGLAAVTLGMSLDGAAIAYLEQTERFKAPVVPGDTVTIKWTVAEKVDKPRFKGGIVTFAGECTNDRGDVVLECEGKAIVTNDPEGLA